MRRIYENQLRFKCEKLTFYLITSKLKPAYAEFLEHLLNNFPFWEFKTLQKCPIFIYKSKSRTVYSKKRGSGPYAVK